MPTTETAAEGVAGLGMAREALLAGTAGRFQSASIAGDELVNSALYGGLRAPLACCVDMNSKDARAKGESEQRLYAVAAWHEAPFFSRAERAAFALTDALTKLAGQPLPDAVLTEAQEQLGADGLADATWVIVTINAWNRVAIAAHMEAGHYEPGA